MEINVNYNESNLETMARMPDNFIDLTVTSPPYDNLRTYKGYSFDFESVAKELYRVTKKGGVVVWIVGDKVNNGSKTLNSFKQALFFKEIGFNVYEKTSPSPPHKNRYFNSFEFMFILSKNTPKKINLLKDRVNKCAGKSSGVITRREYDGSLTRKKAIYINDLGIRTNIWSYNVGNNKSSKDKIAFKHPAIFPEQLANDHIISWSNEGDLIYDPFMGSGTTAKMAKLNNRNWIGSEISEEYCNIIEERIQMAAITDKDGREN